MPKSDAQLLREYVTRDDEAAFAELVHRHTNLVYSAALRQIESPDAASEITQAVFISLASGAASLSRRLRPDASIAGWLCRVARNLSLNFRRDEFRRQTREKEAHFMSSSEPPPDWERVRRVLDDAMSNLSEADYDALVLRFFRNEDLRCVGAALGVSDDAAQKRVTRALEKLRILLGKRGVGISGVALAALIGANAVQAAPTGLTLTICASTALAASSISTSTLIATTTKTIAMTTMQKTFIGLTLTALAATGVYEAHRASTMRERAVALQQREAPMVAQIEELQRERDDAVSRLKVMETNKIMAENGTSELARLRGEVQRLRKDAKELEELREGMASNAADPAIEATLRSWAARASLMKQRLERSPERKIPEMNLLTEKEWLDAAKNFPKLETDEDYRRAFNAVRDGAKSEFGDLARKALRKYAAENDGLLPGDLSQLQGYFDKPVDDAVLQRYALLETGKLRDADGKYLIGETAPPVDEQHDSKFQFSLNGTNSRSLDSAEDMLFTAITAYAKANNGLISRNPAELAPYFTRPMDPAKVRNSLAEIPASVSTFEQLKAVMREH
jgi:RNA polymerase sigma factor (sigma-70 family)